MAHRAADSLRGHCFPAVQGGDFPGDFSVGRHCSVGNPAENLPYRLSEFTSRRIKLQLRYPGSFSRKIAIKPFPGPNQHRNAAAVFRLALQGSRKILLALKPDSDKGIALRRKHDPSQRSRMVCHMMHGISSLRNILKEPLTYGAS